MAAAARLITPLRSTMRMGSSAALRTVSRPAIRVPRRAFSQSTLMQEKRYTDQHEWIELASDGSAKIGITDYAAHALGDVVFVELPSVDTEVTAGEAIGAVESVKSASDIMSPVSGKIVEANTALDEKPKIVNESPEKDGWFARIQVSDQSELQELMDEKTYRASLEEAEES